MAYVELIGAVYYALIAAIVEPMDNILSRFFCRAAPIVLCALLVADALSRLGYLS